MRNTGNLAIWKLVNIVLAGLLLVLILYGVAHGGLNPLIKKVGAGFDNTLVMLHIKTGNTQDCYTENIRNLGGGDSFLNEIGAGKGESVFNVCRNTVCNISVDGLGDYSNVGGGFLKYHDGSWRDAVVVVNSLGKQKTHGSGWVANSFLSTTTSPSEMKFYWELYNEGVKALKVNLIKELYGKDFTKGSTKQFTLYGDGAGLLDSPTLAIWQNGIWKISLNGGAFVTIHDDNKALDEFVYGVKDGWNDKVYWKEIILNHGEASLTSPDVKQPIDDFLKDRDVSGEINSNQDIIALKKQFATEKAKMIKESMPSDEEINQMKKSIGEVKIGNKIFSVGVSEGPSRPVLAFTNGNDKYALKHVDDISRMKIFGDEDFFYSTGQRGKVILRNYPFSIIKWENGKWANVGVEGDSDYYRLPDKYFEEVYKSTLIRNFLNKRCK